MPGDYGCDTYLSEARSELLDFEVSELRKTLRTKNLSNYGIVCGMCRVRKREVESATIHVDHGEPSSRPKSGAAQIRRGFQIARFAGVYDLSC